MFIPVYADMTVEDNTNPFIQEEVEETIELTNGKDTRFLPIFNNDIERIEEEITKIDSVTINGITYGKEYGLKEYTYTEILSPVPTTRMTDWQPYHHYKWTMGTSFVESTEVGYLNYVGKAQAMGNVYAGERVVQAKITYLRAGTVLKTATSSAVFESNTWKAGPLKTVYVFDSINPNAPVTEVKHKFITMDPHLTRNMNET